MTKHTPEPWTLDDVLSNGHCKVRGPYGLVAVVGNGERKPGAFEADARIIAAAPTMLETLKYVREELVQLGFEETSFLDRIEQSIAKAEGR